jgi:MraZ protein
MLIGQYTSKLTDKERVSIPKKIREELGDDLILAKWYENCLVLVSREKWKELLRRVLGETKLVISPVRDIDRFLMSSAYELKLDNQGRFIIPEILKKHAEIETEIIFVGLGDRVEVWSEVGWRKIEESAQEKASKAIEIIARNTKK